MRNLIIICTIITLITAVGCENVFKKSNNDAPTAASSTTDLKIDKSERDGYNINVKIDDTEAVPTRHVNGENFWEVPQCKSTPTIFFEIDPTILGEFQSATLIINPVVDGKIQRTEIWEYAGEETLSPDKAMVLDKFNHYTNDGKCNKGVGSLPAGKYVFNIRVIGNGHVKWDGRAIETEVK
ncbi:MAG: hypothetical protein KAR11_05605 [Phycisphaerae bacterium]|nr:hypothetical protein [Phycisphaerae bacterium]